MQMLYRLSYVGDQPEHPGGQRGTVLNSHVEALHQTLKTWPSDLGGGDTITRYGFRFAKAVGRKYKHRNLGKCRPGCQPETGKK